MDNLLRTRVRVTYEGADITRDIEPDLLSFSYTDNEGGKADDISITLKNDHGKWNRSWLPTRGDKITATIVQSGRGAGFNLPCGTFTIDELEFSGPPSIVAIKGASVPSNSDIMRRQRSRAWENVRLSEIVQDVANTGELSVLYLAGGDPLYGRRDQRDESDMAFLQRMCEDEGFSLKCTDEQIVVFDPREQEKTDPVATIVIDGGNVISYRFSAQTYDIYAHCTVEYTDPQSGRLIQYTYTQPGMAEGKTMKLVRRAESIAEAERRAAAALYKANRAEITGSLELVGDTRLSAGQTIIIEGAGQWSGRYYIETARHEVSSGYKTSIDINSTRASVPE